MKEKLYTIPLNDAVDANDECPLCFVSRDVEHNQLDYRYGGDTVDSFAQKYMAEMTRVFRFLNDLKENKINYDVEGKDKKHHTCVIEEV